METPGEREHGYDDEVEQEAYEQAVGEEAAGDQDAGPASDPTADADRDQAEGE